RCGAELAAARVACRRLHLRCGGAARSGTHPVENLDTARRRRMAVAAAVTRQRVDDQAVIDRRGDRRADPGAGAHAAVRRDGIRVYRDARVVPGDANAMRDPLLAVAVADEYPRGR